MGHTDDAMRNVIKEKILYLKRRVKSMREKRRVVASELVYHIHQHISSITYANPLPIDIDEHVIFSIIVEEKLNGVPGMDELAVAWFDSIVNHRLKQLDDDRSANRLLPRERQNRLVDKI